MVVPPGYKQTEVGVIPEDWSVTNLRHIVVDNKIPSGIYKSKDLYGQGTQIIKISDVFGHDYFLPDLAQRVELNKNEIYDYCVKVGDIIIALASVKLEGVGKVMLVNRLSEVTVFDHNVALIRLIKAVNQEYIFHLFKSNVVRKLVGSLATQVGTTFLKTSTILDFPIPLPPTLREQQAIAEALGDVDGLISAVDALIAKKRALKQGTMQALLTGQHRLPGFAGEWVVKRLADVAPLQRGFDLPTTELRNGEFPVVYSNGILNYHAEYKAKGPGVVTGRSGTIGRVTFVDKNYWPHNTSLWVTDFKGNDPKFIYYLYTYINFERFGTGSGVPTLNRNDVHAYSIHVPTLSEQTAIAQILADMDAEIAALVQKREKTVALKQGMMQALLTGQVRLG